MILARLSLPSNNKLQMLEQVKGHGNQTEICLESDRTTSSSVSIWNSLYWYMNKQKWSRLTLY